MIFHIKGRISKTYQGKTTRWVWDGNVPLHEWTEESDVTTWLFEEGTFVPAAKIVGDKSYSIITDYLGTPTEMFNSDGEKTWSAELDIYGCVRNFVGRSLGDCPFRYQGQYEDEETGLYYNRFRYYSPDSGIYISQDPIGLAGGNPTQYGYVSDVNSWIDPFGLDAFGVNQDVYALYNKADIDIVSGVPIEGAKPYYVGISQNSDIRLGQHTGNGRFNPTTDVKIDLHKDIDYAKARAYEQYYIEKYKAIDKTNPKANQQNSFRHDRTDTRGKAFETEYKNIKHH